jgi:hypothetical protein
MNRQRMSLSAALRLVVVWLGFLLVVDATVDFGLGWFDLFDLGELVIGALCLSISGKFVTTYGLFTALITFSGLIGLARIANRALHGLVYHEPYGFTQIGYGWRIALFLGLGVVGLVMARKGRTIPPRAT